MVIAVIGNDSGTGFNELKRTLCNVSSKTLSSTLKDLEQNGLITRNVEATSPPSVKYYLSVSGWELRELFIPILEWVMKNGGKADAECPIHIPSAKYTSNEEK